MRGENLHDPATVNWLLIDRAQMSDSDRPILTRLLSNGEFAVRYEEQSIVVAERVRAP